jgi:hypothetical protein
MPRLIRAAAGFRFRCATEMPADQRHDFAPRKRPERRFEFDRDDAVSPLDSEAFVLVLVLVARSRTREGRRKRQRQVDAVRIQCRAFCWI